MKMSTFFYEKKHFFLNFFQQCPEKRDILLPTLSGNALEIFSKSRIFLSSEENRRHGAAGKKEEM